jgi:hypothetical protein
VELYFLPLLPNMRSWRVENQLYFLAWYPVLYRHLSYTVLLQIYDALFSHFSVLEIRVLLKFDAFFFTFQKSQKHNFPKRKMASLKEQ